MKPECLIVRAEIIQMFKNLTPSEVQNIKIKINGHLCVCESCRGFFNRYSARKLADYERSKKYGKCTN